MTAPDKIWATFEAHPNPQDNQPYVYASARKTRGEEYTRSDPIPALLAEARAEGYAQGVREVADACDLVKTVSVCASGQEYENGFRDGSGRCLEEALALIDASEPADEVKDAENALAEFYKESGRTMEEVKADLSADAPAQPSVQEAARVLLDADAHTEKHVTRAAANEFPQMGFIHAAAVVGAALRALASEDQT